jgi:hypothetical protein
MSTYVNAETVNRHLRQGITTNTNYEAIMTIYELKLSQGVSISSCTAYNLIVH